MRDEYYEQDGYYGGNYPRYERTYGDYLDEPEDFEPKEKRPKRPRKKIGEMRLLTMIQISACVVILLGAVVVKLLGGDLYETVRGWDVETAGNSIIAQDQLDEVKETIVHLFPAESSASPGQSPEEGSSSTNSEPASSTSSGTASSQGASSAEPSSQQP